MLWSAWNGVYVLRRPFSFIVVQHAAQRHGGSGFSASLDATFSLDGFASASMFVVVRLRNSALRHETHASELRARESNR